MSKWKTWVAVLAIGATLPVMGWAKDYGTAKNIIMMIPDGMSVEALTTARWMNEGKSFTMDEMATGLVRTHNANTPIADSAPAATAYATGVKSESPYIATYPSAAGMPGAETWEARRAKMPLATILEGAQTLGKSTGLVVTSNIQHATPAAFSAHYPDRNNYEVLAEHQVYQNMDVVLGAGSRYLQAEKRADGEDLVSVLKNKGYDYLTTRTELLQSNAPKIWGMFAPKAMSYDLDRDLQQEPSLAEMTEKALQILAQNPQGFFLMVEGSQIDWAAHANEPVALVHDIWAFDRAVAVAKEFADRHPDTVVIVVADHGTGGVTFGQKDISKGYDKAPLTSFARIVPQARVTEKRVAEELNSERTNIQTLLSDHFGITDLSPAEVEEIRQAKEPSTAIGHAISKRSHIGWTTLGHVGGDVALYCYAPSPNAKILTGTVQNRDIGAYMADLFDLDLRALTDRYFIPARPALEAKGAKVEFERVNEGEVRLHITKGDQHIVVPMDKNIAIVNGKTIELEAVTVYNGETCYVSQSLLDLVK